MTSGEGREGGAVTGKRGGAALPQSVVMGLKSVERGAGLLPAYNLCSAPVTMPEGSSPLALLTPVRTWPPLPPACRPIDSTCSCSTCRQYTRAYLHNVVTKNIPSAAILVSHHNIAYTQALTRRMRQAIQVRGGGAHKNALMVGTFPQGEVKLPHPPLTGPGVPRMGARVPERHVPQGGGAAVGEGRNGRGWHRSNGGGQRGGWGGATAAGGRVNIDAGRGRKTARGRNLY